MSVLIFVFINVLVFAVVVIAGKESNNRRLKNEILELQDRIQLIRSEDNELISRCVTELLDGETLGSAASRLMANRGEIFKESQVPRDGFWEQKHLEEFRKNRTQEIHEESGRRATTFIAIAASMTIGICVIAGILGYQQYSKPSSNFDPTVSNGGLFSEQSSDDWLDAGAEDFNGNDPQISDDELTTISSLKPAVK